ncbi:MAG: T9SS type A sorting domain-containing protein [Bacteroidota bacterium]
MNKAFFLALTLFAFVTFAESRQRTLVPSVRPPIVRQSAIGGIGLQNVRVLALRVQFQQDSDPRTTGNGSFLLSGSPFQIDPPPHDSAYFASKLRFLENYFQKVSDSLLTIQADLFDQVVTLSDSMAAYSPGASNLPLAQLMIESWTAASAAAPSFPFSQYDAFIIFHAGCGRDIDLVSLLGFDPTPSDIPSLTLNLETLRLYLEDPAYAGVPVAGSFHVTNSLILPETETRVFTLGNVSDTLQLGINGFLAASFGSYLGLPDLFDTRTGRSGIGQFGLMDGASIFAYNGIFPPEPSAWEKIFLGWVIPITINSGTGSVPLPAVGLTQSGMDTIYKIPVSATEYFLIENRIRDPEGNGQRLTILKEGSIVTRHFGADTSGFIFYDVSLHGSVMDVEDFDWAMPGSALEPGFEGGGILIWHIDETDLAVNLPLNALNANPNKRTVDLEEADGSQDIGVPYELLDPGSSTESGWPLDFWFASNASPVYTNTFDESSFPNSRSNTGAKTLLSVSAFGPKSPRATVAISQGNSQARRLFQSPRLPGISSVSVTVSDSGFYLASSAGVVALRPDGSSRTTVPDGVIDAQGAGMQVAVREGTPTFVVGARDSVVFVRELSDGNNDGLFDSNTLTTIMLADPVTAPPVIIDSVGSPRILIGTAAGDVLTFRTDGVLVNSQPAGSGSVGAIVWFPPSGANPQGNVIISGTSGLTSFPTVLPLPNRTDASLLSGVRFDGIDFVLAADSPTRFSGFPAPLSPPVLSVEFEDLPLGIQPGTISTLVPTDLDKDGMLDVVGSAGSSVIAVNSKGTLLNGFPVAFTSTVVAGPLLVDLDGDGNIDILALTEDGALQALRSTGTALPGFPLQVTASGAGSIGLFRTVIGRIGVLISSGDGGVDGWEWTQAYAPGTGSWLQRFGNAANTGVNVVTPAGPQPPSAAFLPNDRVYNWPNPVYGNSTRIRYYTSAPAQITVKILTIAGELVAEFQTSASGGVDEEIAWDVSGIESGIYFARLEATGSGKHEVSIIKIAVVK